jgi:predicted acylesterase/phospholipase RssA
MTPAAPSYLSSSRPSIGIVLGAGGVRGCAHAGVVAVLREAGIPIDLVVGASVGAMFGLAVASGMPAQRLVDVVRESRPIDLMRFYRGRLRATRSNPIGRMLLDAGDGKSFEDLELPFAVVATDVETGKPVVLDRGPVLPAIEASIALPMIARMAAVEGRYYLDGGMMDTAPVGVARALGADRVIAVCLGYNYMAPGFLRQRPWTRGVLEWLGRQRTPVGGHLRDHLLFTLRLYANSFHAPLPGQDADVAIWPDFGRIGPNSMVGAQFCLEQGYTAAREKLPEMRSLLRDRIEA